jgi:hypothetical protein
MKLLLDENLPKRLKQDLLVHEVFTVVEMGWSGISNGALLTLMIEEGFDVLLTFDKNLQHQQNFRRYSIAVFVLSCPNNTYELIRKLAPQILECLKLPIENGPTEIKLLE